MAGPPAAVAYLLGPRRRRQHDLRRGADRALIGEAQAAPWLIAVYLLSLAWFVWIFGAIWRAAGCYDGPRLFAVLARAGVCLGILRMGLEAVAIAALVTP